MTCDQAEQLLFESFDDELAVDPRRALDRHLTSCPACAALAAQLRAVDARLSAESYNFVLDKEKVEALGIQRSPAIAVMGAEKDYGIRMYGLPSGYEFGTLVEAILDVSSGDSGLSEPTRTALKEIAKPVHVQVFSTPT